MQNTQSFCTNSLITLCAIFNTVVIVMVNLRTNWVCTQILCKLLNNIFHRLVDCLFTADNGNDKRFMILFWLKCMDIWSKSILIELFFDCKECLCLQQSVNDLTCINFDKFHAWKNFVFNKVVSEQWLRHFYFKTGLRLYNVEISDEIQLVTTFN